jgi:type II secretory pathway component GspD/PulD (secretin)
VVVALLNSLSRRALAGGKEYTVFYLESASAVTAAETLESVFGAGGGGGGGGSLMGDLASMALGNVGGGLVGAMMGGSAGGPAPSITASSSVMIVPDVRLNALIVHASPADLDLMEQLLQVIDRPDVPESTVNPKPRLIPVLNTGAAQIAEIIREVYQERMASANRNRQPSPEEFMQMLRGGGGGSRGGASSSRNRQAEGQKISIGVDTRTNSLVVSAAEPVFQEIEQLVKTLDHATTDSNQAIRVVTLKRSNPATVQKALTAIVGEKARTSDKPSDGSGSRGDQQSQGGQGSGGMPQIMSPDSRQIQDMMRQRMESFNQGRGGSSSGGFPGGFGGGRGGGPGGGDRGR